MGITFGSPEAAKIARADRALQESVEFYELMEDAIDFAHKSAGLEFDEASVMAWALAAIGDKGRWPSFVQTPDAKSRVKGVVREAFKVLNQVEEYNEAVGALNNLVHSPAWRGENNEYFHDRRDPLWEVLMNQDAWQ